MADSNVNKCAHIPCLCDVAPGEEYCGSACRDAGSDQVEVLCECGHTDCPFNWATPVLRGYEH